MNKEVIDLWDRACKSLNAASTILDIDPDSAASRAYYAAFHAVSAKFLLEGKIFSKHSALESAVHKELIKPGKWPVEIGQDFSWLSGMRSTGDYGGVLHVNKNDAIKAIEKAKNILKLIESENPSIKE